MRVPVTVRSAERDDFDALAGLCLSARAESALGPQLCSDDRDRLKQHLSTVTAVPGGHLLVAEVDGEVAGLAIARIVGPTAFSETVSLALEALYVGAGQRRRGVGHALLDAALAKGQQAGAIDVYASPLPGARGMQRFLARVGFAPAASFRVASVATVQRKLAEDGGMRRVSVRSIEDVVARRRRARQAEAGSGGSVARRVLGTSAAASGRTVTTMQVTRAVHSL